MRLPAVPWPPRTGGFVLACRRTAGNGAWCVSGAAGSWIWVAPPLPGEVPDGPARVELLGLLASHGDGHVREAAVVALSACPEPAALPFLLWRCTDWVRPVREHALA